MKRRLLQKFLLLLVCLGVMAFAIPAQSPAMETLKWGDGQEFTFWGYLQNNTAMFTQNPNPWGTTSGQSGNQLAIERTVLRTYLDLKFSDQYRFYLVGEGAYEPWYPVEQGSISTKNGSEYSERNVNDVLREVYFEWKPNKKNSIQVGKMNVVWGEAITGRVGDVVNPANLRWTLPTAIEPTDDMRIPQFMIRGIHDIDALSSSFEWIFSPIVTSPEWSVSMANQPANLFLGQAGQRFGMAPEQRFLPPNSLGNTSLAVLSPALAPYGDPNTVATSPFNTYWTYMPQIPGNHWYPGTAFPVNPGAFDFRLHNVTEIPQVTVKYPGDDGFTNNARGGFRTSTLLSGFNFGFIYYHRQVYEPVTRRDGIVSSQTSVANPFAGPGQIYLNTLNTRAYTVEYPDIDNIGFYMNKQLPWPGVIRTEVMYTPNQPFNYFIPLGSDENGVVKRDDFKYLFAYDLTGFLYFDWHKTAPFDITFEHTGEYIPNARELQYIGVATTYATKLPSWQGNFNVNMTTNWFYNRLATGLVAGYGTFGNSWLLVPSVKWMPGWLNNKFSAELKYVYMSAANRYEGLGVWMDKNFIQLKTRFDF